MGSIRSSSAPPPSALARHRAEAVSHVGPHWCHHLAHPRARWCLAGSLAATGDLLGRDRRDHHAVAPTRRRRAAKARFCDDDQDLDLRRLLRLRGPDPLADHVGLQFARGFIRTGLGKETKRSTVKRIKRKKLSDKGSWDEKTEKRNREIDRLKRIKN